MVLGVSGDSVRNQQLFKKANELNFKLLADIKGDVAGKFGVPLRDGGKIEKNVLGKDEILIRGVTPGRWTFVIGANGKIIHKDTGVKAAEDCANVLAALKKQKG